VGAGSALAGGVGDVSEGGVAVGVVAGGVEAVVVDDGVEAVVGDGVEDVVEAVVDTDAPDPPPPPQADIVPAMLRLAVNRSVRLKFRFTVISGER
jgi:hypothetical protein